MVCIPPVLKLQLLPLPCVVMRSMRVLNACSCRQVMGA